VISAECTCDRAHLGDEEARSHAVGEERRVARRPPRRGGVSLLLPEAPWSTRWQPLFRSFFPAASSLAYASIRPWSFLLLVTTNQASQRPLLHSYLMLLRGDRPHGRTVGSDWLPSYLQNLSLAAKCLLGAASSREVSTHALVSVWSCFWPTSTERQSDS
jgi:hypothetical protein